MLNWESSNEGDWSILPTSGVSTLPQVAKAGGNRTSLEKTLTYVSEEADNAEPLASGIRYSYYLQATRIDHRAFLTTNLTDIGQAQVTDIGSTWLLGRSRNCAIMVPDRSISRCHAVIGHDSQQGFYIMDVGSSNGTYLNQQRLTGLKRHTLNDGDIITLCHLRVEFFINDIQK